MCDRYEDFEIECDKIRTENEKVLIDFENCLKDSGLAAVLPDDKTWKYTLLVDKSLIRGLTDFKIKLRGKLEKDLQKLDFI